MQTLFNFSPFILLLLAVACNTSNNSNPINITVSETSIEKMGLADNSIIMQVEVTNGTNQAATIHWDHIEQQTVLGWTYELNGSTSNSGTLNIPANTSIGVTLTVIPNGNIGVGMGSIEFYDPMHQQLTSKTVHYKSTALKEYFRLNLANPSNATSYISNSTPTESYIHHVWVINDNTTPIAVHWKRTEESRIPSNWVLAAKTHEICYTPPILSDVFTSIPPMDSVPFKLIFGHHNQTGYGEATPIFWVNTDSSNSVKSQLFTYKVLP